MPQTNKIYIRNWGIAIIMVPIICICSYVSLEGIAKVDIENHTCTSPFLVKVFVLSWIFLMGAFVLLLSLGIEKGIEDEYLSEYKQIRSILMGGLLVLLINLPINSLGLLRYSWARSIFTVNIAILYLFSFARFFFFRIAKSLVNDEEFTINVLSSHMSYDLRFNTIHDLAQSPDHMNAFLDHCRKQDVKTDMRNEKQVKIGYAALLMPHHMVDLYRSILLWKEKKSSGTDKDEMIATTHVIVNGHLLRTSPFRVSMPEHIVQEVLKNIQLNSRDLFDDVLFQLEEDLEYAWGGPYLEQVNKASTSIDSISMKTAIPFEKSSLFADAVANIFSDKNDSVTKKDDDANFVEIHLL